MRSILLVAFAIGVHVALSSDNEEASVASLEPMISVRLGKDEIRGLLMGSAAQEMGVSPAGFPASALQRTAQAAVYRAEKDVKQQEAREEGGELFKVQGNQLGETAPAKKLQWTYQSTNWENWPLCRTGNKQSPTNLARPFFGAFLKLKQKYKDQLWPVQENDGRVLKVHFKQGDGSVLGIGDKEYTPVEAHFHSPSEHKLDGKTFDMEMQVLHKDTAGNMMGLAVLMQTSTNIPKDNFYVKNVFGHFFEDLPKVNHKRRVESMNLKWILNEKMMNHYVTYHGSLTQPPCTEGVEWFILGRPWLIEKKWLANFKKALVTPNVRPEQSRGGRMFKSF